MSCGVDDERGKRYLRAIPDLADEIRDSYLERRASARTGIRKPYNVGLAYSPPGDERRLQARARQESSVGPHLLTRVGVFQCHHSASMLSHA